MEKFKDALARMVLYSVVAFVPTAFAGASGKDATVLAATFVGTIAALCALRWAVKRVIG